MLISPSMHLHRAIRVVVNEQLIQFIMIYDGITYYIYIVDALGVITKSKVLPQDEE